MKYNQFEFVLTVSNNTTTTIQGNNINTMNEVFVEPETMTTMEIETDIPTRNDVQTNHDELINTDHAPIMTLNTTTVPTPGSPAEKKGEMIDDVQYQSSHENQLLLCVDQ